MARFGLGVGVMVLAIGFAMIGGMLCLWAGYAYLSLWLGQTLAAFIIGICAIVVAGICLWISRKLAH
jgi:hypothetical protein